MPLKGMILILTVPLNIIPGKKRSYTEATPIIMRIPGLGMYIFPARLALLKKMT